MSNASVLKLVVEIFEGITEVTYPVSEEDSEKMAFLPTFSKTEL